MNTNKGYTVVELLIVILWLAGATGWIWNVVKIVGAINDPINAMFVVRCVGVFVAPLGAVVGFLP